MAKKSNPNSNLWASIPSHVYNQPTQGPWTSSNTLSILEDEDVEEADKEIIKRLAEKYFETTYPEIKPEIVFGLEKEYYLPALKVLLEFHGNFFSPQEKSKWVDGELRAECRREDKKSIISPAYFHAFGIEQVEEEYTPHDAPNEKCNCGIYGSVNLEELYVWLRSKYQTINPPPNYNLDGYNVYSLDVEIRYPQPVLCVVEPMPDAKVIICRKGWKASHVFISEIVDDTISVDDTSQLLSLAWKRNIDVRRLYENR